MKSRSIDLEKLESEIQLASLAVAESEKAARENNLENEAQMGEVFCKAREQIMVVESRALANKEMRKALQKIANTFHHQLDRSVRMYLQRKTSDQKSSSAEICLGNERHRVHSDNGRLRHFCDYLIDGTWLGVTELTTDT